MTNDYTRRRALTTLAATGLAAALAPRLAGPALAQTSARFPAFGSRRTLENSMYFGSGLFSFLAESKDTGGAYAIIDATSPGRSAAPPHTHTREDEIFFILEGEVEFTAGGVVTLAKPGDQVFLPRGVTHSFRVPSSSPARALTIFTPGGLEGAYRQLARPATSLELPPSPPPATPEQLARVARVFAAYGYTFAAQ